MLVAKIDTNKSKSRRDGTLYSVFNAIPTGFWEKTFNLCYQHFVPLGQFPPKTILTCISVFYLNQKIGSILRKISKTYR